MPTDLKASIRKALAGSSSQQPVDVAALYRLGDVQSVQTALLEMYRDREIYCCLNIKRGKETSIWWTVGGQRALPSYGISGTWRIKPARVTA